MAQLAMANSFCLVVAEREPVMFVLFGIFNVSVSPPLQTRGNFSVKAVEHGQFNIAVCVQY